MPLNIIVTKFKHVPEERRMERAAAHLMQPGGRVDREWTQYHQGGGRDRQLKAIRDHYRHATPDLKNLDFRPCSVTPVKQFVAQHLATRGEQTSHGQWQKFVQDHPELSPWKR